MSQLLPAIDSLNLGILGLGYVGLPLAVAFGKQFCTIGFDINRQRIAELMQECDSSLEVELDELRSLRL